MSIRRTTVTLHSAHPLDAPVIDFLSAYGPRRRPARIRQLVAAGLEREVPRMPLTNTASLADAPFRVELRLDSDQPEDRPLIAALDRVHPALVSEWLRDRLAAGLLGVDIELGSLPAPKGPGQIHTSASLLAAAAPLASQQPSKVVLRGQAAPAEEDSIEAAPRRRADLKGLFS